MPVARGLFEKAPTPAAVAALSVAELDDLIRPCTFHEEKAKNILAIARQTVSDHGGTLPCDRETLLAFRGVGPKCANLTLGIACNLPLIGVDIHVHRVTNRWGLVAETTPEKTMAARSSTNCRVPTGSRSTLCSCRSASMSARGSARNAPPARSWKCVNKSASRRIAERRGSHPVLAANQPPGAPGPQGED